jgi:hypothetical protein
MKTEKPCSQCKVVQSLDEYHQYKSGPRVGRYWSQCKSCRYKQLKEWRKLNPEKYKQNYRKGRYQHYYNLDILDKPDNGICPICLKYKKLIVDHDHSIKEKHYRGFICYNCNTLLGHIENTEKLNRVKQYLKVESL